METCVVFKSYKRFFEKENSGRKNNTVRKVDKDKRFELLKVFDRIGTLYIKIECIETDNASIAEFAMLVSTKIS